MRIQRSVTIIYSSDVAGNMQLRKSPSTIILLNHLVSLTYGPVITPYPSYSITYCAVARGMFRIPVVTQRNVVGWRLLKISTPTYPYPEQRQYKPSRPEL